MTSEHGCSALDRGRSPCARPMACRGRTLGLSLSLSLSLSPSPRAEYAFRLAVSRLSWVTSPERGRPARVAGCLLEIRYAVPAQCYDASRSRAAAEERHPSAIRRRMSGRQMSSSRGTIIPVSNCRKLAGYRASSVNLTDDSDSFSEVVPPLTRRDVLGVFRADCPRRAASYRKQEMQFPRRRSLKNRLSS